MQIADMVIAEGVRFIVKGRVKMILGWMQEIVCNIIVFVIIGGLMKLTKRQQEVIDLLKQDSCIDFFQGPILDNRWCWVTGQCGNTMNVNLNTFYSLRRRGLLKLIFKDSLMETYVLSEDS